MSATLRFFAMNTAVVNSRLADKASAVATESLEIESVDDDAESWRGLTELVEDSSPEECSDKHFRRFAKLLCEVTEEIEIPDFICVRGFRIIDEIGIWPWFQGNQMPFPVPKVSDPPPEVGFMPLEKIRAVFEFGFDSLPSCSFDSDQARVEFKDVLETLIEDQLDLMAILLPA